MAETGSTESKAQPQVNLDGLGIFWIAFALSWTFIVAGGMIFLWRRRDMPILRIRGLPLSFLAITLLHLYWGTVQAGYFYFPLTSPQVEYWIMSIYLPCGIALFHVSNSRFLVIVEAQKELLTSDAASIRSKSGNTSSLISHFRPLDYTRKILLLVGAGMGFQVLLTLFMYLISRKFHPSFGILGTEISGTEDVQKLQIRRGWEWWPSIFWQFFWTWIVAPYTLWRARGINDTQGWRTQTIACCLSSLHATPMWLIALYLPAMSSINHIWVPPQWIAISIMMLEIFTIFLPCWEVIRYQTLRQEHLSSIVQWQLKVARPSLSAWSKDDPIKGNTSEILLTMEALECVLWRNPRPLQQFSALRDLSGENIAFLGAVADWKSSLPPAIRSPEEIKLNVVQELLCERFNSALQIYVDFISSRSAEFQIYLSSQDLKRLEFIFEPYACILSGDKRNVDPAPPFGPFAMTTKAKTSSASPHGFQTGIMTRSINETDGMEDKTVCWDDIPDGFDATIFDNAEASIKYFVWTNTWPKFVKQRPCLINSNDNIESGNAVTLPVNHGYELRGS
ncbi:hypothetical protein MRS44_017645 [Fusarium solani]|uniref:uncharacterized protein n=1 Tax=Fusarium solani TaxID=169388 RepID=UPI0032C40F57|nr:hypothetical protein MRS44_017645 [Fusarium solani]